MNPRRRRLLLKPLSRRSRGIVDWDALVHALKRLDNHVINQDLVSTLGDIVPSLDLNRYSEGWKDPEAASTLVAVVKALYGSGRLPTPMYVFLACVRVEAVHEGRWLDDHYEDELGPIRQAMCEIKSDHGLAPDDDWAIHEVPEEYARLDAQYSAILDKRFLDTLREFGLPDLAEMASKNPKELARLRERGRRSIFLPDKHMQALKDVVLRYEADARLAASAKAYSAAVTSLGAGLEGLLLLRCLRSPHKASQVSKSLDGRHRVNHNDPMTWRFEHLIEVCKAAGWLPSIETSVARYKTTEIAHYLRRLRNHVHPARYIREQPWHQAEQRDYEDAEAFYTVLLSSLGVIRKGSRDRSKTQDGAR